MAAPPAPPAPAPPPLPTFLVIGSMKAGTTSLWRELRRHPDVFVPDVKEFQFFSDKRQLAKGIDWYRAQFVGADGQHAIGEASTGYAKHPRPTGVPERIAEALPDVRLVYLVRDPIARIRSHYLHSVHKARETRPIDQAVREVPAYLAISRYRTQIDQYLAAFPADRLLVITTEDLRQRREATLGAVFTHLGVDPATALADTLAEVPVEEHRSADKRLDTTLSDTIRRLPWYRFVADRAGAGFKRRYRAVATTSVSDTVDTTMQADTEAWIRTELADEVAGLRPFLREDWDGWGIA